MIQRRMKYLIILPVIVAGLFLNECKAQDTLRLTLAQALQKAEENKFTLKNSALDLRLAQNNIVKSKAENRPQLNAGLDTRYNTRLQTNVLPDFVNPNSNAVRLVQFGARFNTVLGLDLTQNIYNPLNRAEREELGLDVIQAELSLESEKENVRYAVYEAYYSLMLNRESLELQKENLDRANSLFERGKVRLENGTLIPSQFNQLEIDKINAQNGYDNALLSLQLSEALLGDRMGLSEPVPILALEQIDQLATTVSAIKQAPDLMQDMTEWKQEQTRLSLNAAKLQNLQARYLPVVAGYANFSVQQQTDEFNYFQGDSWFPFHYLGLRLNLPLYDGNQLRIDRQAYNYRIEQNKNNLKQIESNITLARYNAEKQVKQAVLNYESAKRNYALAQETLMVEKVRFDSGTTTLADYKQTEYSLQNAQYAYFTATYNYMIAQLAWIKAAGKI